MGRNVRRARRYQSITLEALAGRVGKSKGWLSGIENGHLRLEKRSDIAALAEALSVSADTLLGQCPGANHHGVRTAALVLPAVINELDTHARTYAKAADYPYWCSCGYACIGLAAFDSHLDGFPPESPESHAHREFTPDSSDHPARRGRVKTRLTGAERHSGRERSSRGVAVT